jgi:hypothetical protein
MKYYFKIVDNNVDTSTVYSEEDLSAIFAGYDFSGPPPDGYIEYKMTSVSRALNPYDKVEIVGYEFESDTCIRDNIRIVQVAGEEKLARIEKIKSDFYAKFNRPTWKFYETFGAFEPPEYPPRDGWIYKWDDTTQHYRNVGILQKDLK